jgi:hypothetical protein
MDRQPGGVAQFAGESGFAGSTGADDGDSHHKSESY